MIFKENELKTCIQYVLNPILEKKNLLVKDIQLRMDEHIYIQAKIQYQNYIFACDVCFDINYKHDCFCFEHVDGKIEYSFLVTDLLHALQQFINDRRFYVKDDSCYYQWKLPIRRIVCQNKEMNIEFIEESDCENGDV